MSELLITRIDEPEFPKLDISDENTSFLAVMLSSPDLQASTHAFAEEAVVLYKLGHSAINKYLQAILGESQIRAASAGVATYEALSILVTNNPPDIKRDGEGILRIALAQTYQSSNSIIDSLTAFRDEMPNTADIVAESTGRLVPPELKEYAIAGAAAARQLEMSI